MTDFIEFEPHRARSYRKRSEILAFESKDAITYHKSWGRQDLPEGAWVAVALDNDGNPTGEVYGIDADAFRETYQPSTSGIPNRYMKTATIEAYQPGHEFFVRTELEDQFSPGKKKIEVAQSAGSSTAMLVRNPGGEIYPIEEETFLRTYVEVQDRTPAKTVEEHLDAETPPKRILALDGGGVRNLLTLGALESLETLLQKRHGDPDLRLSDYFDLIAGTSTAAVVGGALAVGKSVREVLEWYRSLAPHVFAHFRTASDARPQHDDERLQAALSELFEDSRLGDDRLQTGLLVVLKQLQRPGVWTVTNNPRQPQWTCFDEDNEPGVCDLTLRQVLRASSASPFPLQPDTVELQLRVGEENGAVFVNGGLSPHNNPALQALLTAARARNGLGWETGIDELLVVSVGAGWSSAQHELRGLIPSDIVQSFHATLNDSAEQVETILEWMADSATEPLLSYRRYDAELDHEWLKDELGLEFDEAAVQRMRTLDAYESSALDALIEIGRAVGVHKIDEMDLPDTFDIAIG